MHVSAQPGRAYKHGQLAAYNVLYLCGRGQGWKGRPGSGLPPVRPPGGDPRLEYKIRLGPAPHPYLFPFGRGGGRVVTRGWSSNGWVEENASGSMRRDGTCFSWSHTYLRPLVSEWLLYFCPRKGKQVGRTQRKHPRFQLCREQHHRAGRHGTEEISPDNTRLQPTTSPRSATRQS